MQELIKIQVGLSDDVEKLNAQFSTILNDFNKILPDVTRLLSSSLSMEVNSLISLLDECVNYSYNLSELKIRAEKYLLYYQVLYYKSPSKDSTVSDRKLYVDIRTVEKENLVNNIENMEKKLDKKISLGQSILKYKSQVVHKQ